MDAFENRVENLTKSMAVDFMRQKDWFDPETRKSHVSVIGCGGIGGLTAVLLSKLGVTYLTLVDPDVVERHNVPNQFYALNQVGEPKVTSLKAVCELFGTANATAVQATFQEQPAVLKNEIIVTGLDSIDARKELWTLLVGEDKGPSARWLVDGRLAGQNIQLYTIDTHNPDQVEYYESEALFDASEAVEAPCTARAVMDVMGFVASLVVRQVRLILTNQEPDPAISFPVSTLEVWLPWKELQPA